MIGLLLGALALAAPPCADPDPLQPRLSVAWVSPVGRQVAAGTWLSVVPTVALRDWIAAEDADLARVLQALGERRSPREPKRGWKVTIFEVDALALCRPLPDAVPGDLLGGAPVCALADRKLALRDDGCGHTLDLHTDAAGLDVLNVQWRDAATRGFCVLPMERFLEGR